jgi:SAM-dependent methyltransferase
MANKPYSESCDQNKEPILNVLEKVFEKTGEVLEIGSGTGQHAVFFPQKMPHLIWQPSDVAVYIPGINAWLEEMGLNNVRTPIVLDVADLPWQTGEYEYIFSANTAHIMGWPEVQCLFQGVGQVLKTGGHFCLYGPFNYAGKYTSESNARFDGWLKARDPKSGVRDFEKLDELAGEAGLQLTQDFEMPANNRTLVWEKTK